MNRRHALKGLAGVTLAAVGYASVPAVAATLPDPAPVPLLQGTPDGRILQSLDGGHTWNTVAKFGAHTSVDSLEVLDDRVYAKISVAGQQFVIVSKDARKWYTASP